MGRRRRTCRVLKWGGLLLSVAILAIAVTNLHWILNCRSDRYALLVWRGSVSLYWSSHPWVPEDPRGYRIQTYRSFSEALAAWREGGLVPSYRPGALAVPLWMLLVLTILLTAILWRLDRQPLPDHCRRCGYDLTGNESGVCPECGQAVQTEVNNESSLQPFKRG